MDSIVVTPHQGIGPLQLGMTPQQITAAIQELCSAVPLSSHRFQMAERACDGLTTVRYVGDSAFFMVEYRDGCAVEIAVDDLLRASIPVVLNGMDVFKTPAEEILRALKQLDTCTFDLEDEQLSTNYEFAQLGLRLWREDAFHPKLLQDPRYREEMALVLDEMYRYEYFQLVAVRR